MSRYATRELIEKSLGSDLNKSISNIKEISNNDATIPDIKNWRGFGSFIDSNNNNNNNTTNNTSDSNLHDRINYRICNSCGTAISVDKILEHLENCDNLNNQNNNNKNKNNISNSNNAVVIDLDDVSSPSVEVDKKERKNGNGTVNGNGNGTGNINGSGKKGGYKRKADTEDLTEESEIPEDKIQDKGQEQDKSLNKGSEKEKLKIKIKATKDKSNNDKKDSVEPDKKKVKIDSTSSTTSGKKKKETKIKTVKSKNKGPVDVERQCGVPLPNGGFCARSLTCKTHSMGAKRAVLGRSAPYDQLLAAYQRKNQAKIGAAAAAAQQAKDDLLHGSSVALDDEEETRQVLAGVRRSIPFPLERNVCIPVKMRTGYLRMREMFATNLLPRLQTNPLGKMYARAAVMNVENINEQIYFPVRSQHQKNNQQRMAMKQNQALTYMQMQKKAQIQQAQMQQAQMQQGQLQSQNLSQAQLQAQQAHVQAKMQAEARNKAQLQTQIQNQNQNQGYNHQNPM